MSIREFCTKNVVTAMGEETLFDAAKKMWLKNVGAVVVIDDKRVPVGIVTDRDIAVKGVAQGKDPETTPLSAVMNEDVVVLSEERGLFETARIMCEQGVRRIPIVDGEGRLAGIVSLDDLMMVLGGEMASLAGTVAYGGAAGRKIAAIG